ncbi:transcription factor IIIB 90 kDa subunit-like [Macadamia integrifolia]|uniref:transcription factor IIIB 90 kDa subunit-like n=1 Tax=Macadamia integrifolia TaxID=60698 RepID=UPI001C4E894A|nr:transcription factor IIIB 90 kDa subunit-like [Macadamia integrifolia]XP_042510052.1 transcription factor IIIB 90 kDa subunit-like [Macadamia integrifolia]XP_042510053.1 transcription factor IIIB 90 kDa subunit-like [Macadamia integrifolia]XP_042510054.1 transcription factor IIIB 90 kDa subunit-like [Macadamia integrifolia]
MIENDRIDYGAAAEYHFVDQGGSCQSHGNENMDNVVGDESESLSDIDDIEVGGYLHNEEEKRYKKIIWEKMNSEYLENCSEDFFNAQELAAATTAAVAKSRKVRKQKHAANAKNGTPTQTAAEANREMLSKKRLSSKINYDALEKLFADSAAPEVTKKKRVGSDPDSDVYVYQQKIGRESGEKELESDAVDNDVSAYGDDYYGNEEDGYGYDNNHGYDDY